MMIRSRSGKLTHYLAFLLLFIWLLHSMSANAHADSLPSIDIRHTVYSETAAELFWDRVPAPADARVDLLYRISVDGVAVPNRLYGISYFTDVLRPGQDYEFVVEAVLGRNKVIARGSLIINTQADPEETAPFPSNLRGLVYSPGVFEIFWSRNPEPLTYEIYRSGGELLAITDGNSYFFNHEPAFKGPSAFIDVIAVDRAGNRSGVAYLRLEIGRSSVAAANPAPIEPPAVEPTPGEAMELFTPQNAPSVLKNINDQLLASPINQEVMKRYRQITDERNLTNLRGKGFMVYPASNSTQEGIESSSIRVECPGGGSYVVERRSTRAGRSLVHEFEFDGCKFDGVRHAGKVFSFRDETTSDLTFAGTFNSYTQEFDDGRRILLDTGWRAPGAEIYSQVIKLQSSNEITSGGSRRFLLNGRYTITSADGSTMTVENANINWNNRTNGSNCVQLSMRVNAPWTAYQTVQVDTYDDNWSKGDMCDDLDDSLYLSSGLLSISDGLGRSITLDAQGEAGYNLMIADSPITSEQFELPWSGGECVLESSDIAVSCAGPPPLY